MSTIEVILTEKDVLEFDKAIDLGILHFEGQLQQKKEDYAAGITTSGFPERVAAIDECLKSLNFNTTESDRRYGLLVSRMLKASKLFDAARKLESTLTSEDTRKADTYVSLPVFGSVAATPSSLAAREGGYIFAGNDGIKINCYKIIRQAVFNIDGLEDCKKEKLSACLQLICDRKESEQISALSVSSVIASCELNPKVASGKDRVASAVMRTGSEETDKKTTESKCEL